MKFEIYGHLDEWAAREGGIRIKAICSKRDAFRQSILTSWNRSKGISEQRMSACN